VLGVRCVHDSAPRSGRRGAPASCRPRREAPLKCPGRKAGSVPLSACEALSGGRPAGCRRSDGRLVSPARPIPARGPRVCPPCTGRSSISGVAWWAKRSVSTKRGAYGGHVVALLSLVTELRLGNSVREAPASRAAPATLAS
jgi:hypothetical protein